MKRIEDTKSYRIALLGLLCAVAIALSALENSLPAVPFMPPGAKAGFSNIATMFAASAMGLFPALCVTLLKALFAFLTRGATAFFMSLAGGTLSTAVMYLLFRYTRRIGYIEIGILSALAHNAGQLAVAAALVSNGSVSGYAPVLLIAALLSGSVTGAVLKSVIPKLRGFISPKDKKGGK